MGTAIKHPVPDRVKPSFVIFNIRALWRSVWHRMLYSCTHMATVGFKGCHDSVSQWSCRCTLYEVKLVGCWWETDWLMCLTDRCLERCCHVLWESAKHSMATVNRTCFHSTTVLRYSNFCRIIRSFYNKFQVKCFAHVLLFLPLVCLTNLWWWTDRNFYSPDDVLIS